MFKYFRKIHSAFFKEKPLKTESATTPAIAPQYLQTIISPDQAISIVRKEELQFVIDHGSKRKSILLGEVPPEHAKQQISQENALDIIYSSRENGYINYLFSQKSLTGKFFGICQIEPNKCSSITSQKFLPSGQQIAKHIRCASCGYCLQFCPFSALSLRFNILSINEDKCRGCGSCLTHCTRTALYLYHEPEKGPLYCSLD